MQTSFLIIPVILTAILASSESHLFAQRVVFQKGLSDGRQLSVLKQELPIGPLPTTPPKLSKEDEEFFSKLGGKAHWGIPDHRYLLEFRISSTNINQTTVLWRHEYVTGRDLVAGGGYHTYDAFVEMDALVLLYSQSSQIMANIILKDIQRERLLLDTRESQLMRNTGTWVAREGIIQGAFSNETLAVILTGSDGVTYRFLLQKKDNKYSWRLQKPVGSGEKPVPAECIPASVIPQQSLKSHGVKPPEAGKQ